MTEALGCLQHGGTGPAQCHGSISPAFDIAADAPDCPHHVLDDIGAGERAAQFGGKPETDHGQDFVEALQDAGGDAGRRPLHVGALGAPDGLEAPEGLALVFKPEE